MGTRNAVQYKVSVGTLTVSRRQVHRQRGKDGMSHTPRGASICRHEVAAYAIHFYGRTVHQSQAGRFHRQGNFPEKVSQCILRIPSLLKLKFLK